MGLKGVTAVIADDELIQRNALSTALFTMGVNVLAEFQDGSAVLNWLKLDKRQPDIFFLDVKMPILNGIETAKEILATGSTSSIVLVTAHRDYGPEAFEMSFLDYILKPATLDKIQRVLSRLEERRNGFTSRSTLNQKSVEDWTNVYFKCKASKDIFQIKAPNIMYFEYVDQIVYAFDTCNKKQEIVGHSRLNGIESKLNYGGFIRVFKHLLVNQSAIKGVIERPGRDHNSLLLNNGVELPISRGHWEKIKELSLPLHHQQPRL